MEKTIKRAKKLLLTLGITPNLNGYNYSTIAICKLYELTNACEDISFCKLYEDVANEVASTGTRVERSIRHAINYTSSQNLEHWEKVLNCKLQDGITVSKFLSLCVENLLMNEGF